LMVVTTSRHPTAQEEARARALAEELGLPYAARRGSLADLGATAALVVTRERLVVHTAAGEIFFHPGMARPRVRELERGKPDVMVEAMGLRPGDAVLDCTLGLGSDAIVAAYVVGEQGRVVGLEAVAVLAAVVRWGLKHYDPGMRACGRPCGASRWCMRTTTTTWPPCRRAPLTSCTLTPCSGSRSWSPPTCALGGCWPATDP